MGYLVGLLTSLHCIAMCGGIDLSQGLARKEGETRSAPVRTASGLLERLRPSLLYNGGRIVSYTLIGGIVGVLGSLFSLSTAVPADHAGVRPGNGKLPRGGLLLLKANAVLVIVLGFVMLTRGLTLFGVALPRVNGDTTVAVAQISGSVQEVKTTVRKGQYHPFIVQSGIPARWIVSAKAEDLDNCNNPS